MSDERWVETDVKVRYAETDAQGVVYHGSYVVWFEVGRTEYCEAAGYPYPRMEAEGVQIVVVDLSARFRRPARYGDVVRVATRLAAIRSRGCTFVYRVFLSDGRIAVEGETVHVFVDAATGRTVAAPDPIRSTLAAWAAG
ncbi:MAG: acyl-CoA thioesterase [Thermoanaerobaculia bacterium]